MRTANPRTASDSRWASFKTRPRHVALALAPLYAMACSGVEPRSGSDGPVGSASSALGLVGQAAGSLGLGLKTTLNAGSGLASAAQCALTGTSVFSVATGGSIQRFMGCTLSIQQQRYQGNPYPNQEVCVYADFPPCGDRTYRLNNAKALSRLVNPSIGEELFYGRGPGCGFSGSSWSVMDNRVITFSSSSSICPHDCGSMYIQTCPPSGSPNPGPLTFWQVLVDGRVVASTAPGAPQPTYTQSTPRPIASAFAKSPNGVPGSGTAPNGLASGANGSGGPGGPGAPPPPTVGDPVTIAQTAFINEPYATLSMPDGLGGSVGLVFRSDLAEQGIGATALSPSGGWTRTYGRSLQIPTDGLSPLVLSSDDGTTYSLPQVASGSYRSSSLSSFSATKQPDGSFLLRYPNGNLDSYTPSGDLSSITDPSGIGIAFSNLSRPCSSGPNAGSPDCTEKVVVLSRFYADGSLGPSLEEVYRLDSSGTFRLAQLNDGLHYSVRPSTDSRPQRVVSLQRDSSNRISGYTDEHGGSWGFSYSSNPADPRLTTLSDPNNNCVSTSYNPDSGVASQTTGPCSGPPSTTLSFSDSWLSDPNRSLTLTYNSGRPDQRVETFQRNDLGQITQHCAQTQGSSASTKCSSSSYDAMAHLTRSVDPDGVGVTTVFGAEGWLSSSAVDGGPTTTFARNPLGLPTAVAVSGRPSTSIAYASSPAPLGRVLSITSGSGAEARTTSFEYSSKGLPSAVTSSSGRRDSIARTAMQQPSQVYFDAPIANPAAGLWLNGGTSSLDWLGQASSVVDVRGRTNTFSWSPGGRLLTRQVASGPTTTLSYDAIGNLTQVSAVDGSGATRTVSTQYALTGHDAVYRPTSFTDPAGNVSSAAYNSYGEPVSVTDSTGRTTTFTKTIASDGSVTVVATDPLAQTSTQVFTAAGRLSSSTDARGVKTVHTYDSYGRLTTTRNPVTNETTTFVYDTIGQVVGISDASGSTTSYSYDSKGRVVSSTDPKNRTTFWSYDASGNLTSISINGGQTRTYTYDSKDRVLTDTISEAGVQISKTSYTYDNLDRATQITLQNNGETHTTTRVFDTWGSGGTDRFSLKQEYDTVGRNVFYGYDADGNLNYVQRPNEATVTYSYDSWGNLISEQRDGTTVTRTYDALDRLVSLSEAGATETRSYDAAGRLLSTTDLAGQTTSYSYDAAGRILAVAPPNTVDGASFTYLPNGLLASVTAASGDSTAYSYDASNRLVGRTQKWANLPGILNGLNRTFARSAGGWVTRVDQPSAISGQSPLAINVEYDAVHAPTRLTTDANNAFNVTLDSLNRTTSTTLTAPRAPSASPTTIWTTSVTRSAGEVSGMVMAGPSFSYSNALTRQNQRRSRRVQTFTPLPTGAPSVETDSFTYDRASGGLWSSSYSSISGSTGKTRSFLHAPDVFGNLKASPDGLTPLSVASNDTLTGTNFTTDSAGNLTAATLATGESWTFSYDSLNRLAASTSTQNALVNGQAVPETFFTSYRYDGSGNLSGYSLTFPNGSRQATNFVIDDSTGLSRVVAELRSDGTEVHYLHGGNGPLIQRTLKPGQAEVQRFAITNELGSVQSWSTSSGVLSERSSYNAFGGLLENVGPDVKSRRFSLTTSNANTGRTDSISFSPPLRFAPPAYALATAAASGRTPTLRLTFPDGTTGTCTYGYSNPAGSLLRSFVSCKKSNGTALPVPASSYFLVSQISLAAMPTTVPNDAEIRVDITERLTDGSPAPRPSGFGFAGEWTNPDGTVFLRARHYFPPLGRFLQRDSFEGFRSSAISRNRYSYAENQPVELLDPTGHSPTAAGGAFSAGARRGFGGSGGVFGGGAGGGFGGAAWDYLKGLSIRLAGFGDSSTANPLYGLGIGDRSGTSVIRKLINGGTDPVDTSSGDYARGEAAGLVANLTVNAAQLAPLASRALSMIPGATWRAIPTGLRQATFGTAAHPSNWNLARNTGGIILSARPNRGSIDPSWLTPEGNFDLSRASLIEELSYATNPNRITVGNCGRIASSCGLDYLSVPADRAHTLVTRIADSDPNGIEALRSFDIADPRQLERDGALAYLTPGRTGVIVTQTPNHAANIITTPSGQQVIVDFQRGRIHTDPSTFLNPSAHPILFFPE